MHISPLNVTKYLLFKCSFFGDVITNLKMQKLLYFVYVWGLVKKGEPIFEEKFQAWPNGPVLKSVYNELKQYGAMPIDLDFSNIEKKEDLKNLEKSLGECKKIVDEVFEKYGSLQAFQLVNITHQEKSWLNAREGLDVDEPSNNELLDDDILSQYGEEK